MAVFQDTYFLPDSDDIVIGLATGVYKRCGSVIRYASGPNKGRIVKHLDPIKTEAVKSAGTFASKALKFVQNHKTETGIVFIGTIAVGTGIWGYNKWRTHEPKALLDFRVSLRAYIQAIRTGNMSIERITDLMQALEVLKNHKRYEKISIQLTAEDLETLVGRIYEYTAKLAADNSVELTEPELRSSCSVITNLQTCLKAQKRIFETVA